MSDKREVVILNEGWLSSLVKDAGLVATFTALIGIGVLLDSTAMQWVGALVGFFVLFSVAQGIATKRRLTIPEARKRLDELETEWRKP